VVRQLRTLEWNVVDTTIWLTLETEWRQEVPEVLTGDTLTLEADGDTPFYAAILSSAELKKRRSKLNDAFTTFPLGSAQGTWEDTVEAKGSGTYTVVVARRGVDSNLVADVWVSLSRPGVSGPATSETKPRPPYDPKGFPKPQTIPRSSAGLYLFASAVSLVGMTLLILAVMFVNVLVYVYDGGVGTLPALLVGDGTLSLAIVTAASVASGRRFQVLTARRERRRRLREP
jgi:hypothetical protein